MVIIKLTIHSQSSMFQRQAGTTHWVVRFKNFSHCSDKDWADVELGMTVIKLEGKLKRPGVLNRFEETKF